MFGPRAFASLALIAAAGCIRLTSRDATDLYSRVSVGTKVILLPMERRADNAPGERARFLQSCTLYSLG